MLNKKIVVMSLLPWKNNEIDISVNIYAGKVSLRTKEVELNSMIATLI